MLAHFTFKHGRRRVEEDDFEEGIGTYIQRTCGVEAAQLGVSCDSCRVVLQSVAALTADGDGDGDGDDFLLKARAEICNEWWARDYLPSDL